MANRDSKLIERILKDFSLNINHGDDGALVTSHSSMLKAQKTSARFK